MRCAHSRKNNSQSEAAKEQADTRLLEKTEGGRILETEGRLRVGKQPVGPEWVGLWGRKDAE